jgi:non-ribosomal peptide synthetase component E (peptide arylation enzyme)
VDEAELLALTERWFGDAPASGGSGGDVILAAGAGAGPRPTDHGGSGVVGGGSAAARAGVSADADGYFTFRGRLKRFLKAGGEMISLPALEEPFQKRFPPDDNGPRVAVEGIETPDGRHVVLFTTFDLPLRDASEILLADGLRGVMRLDQVRWIDRIPVLGTGKTDYTSLRRLVTELHEAG